MPASEGWGYLQSGLSTLLKPVARCIHAGFCSRGASTFQPSCRGLAQLYREKDGDQRMVTALLCSNLGTALTNPWPNPALDHRRPRPRACLTPSQGACGLASGAALLVPAPVHRLATPHARLALASRGLFLQFPPRAFLPSFPLQQKEVRHLGSVTQRRIGFLLPFPGTGGRPTQVQAQARDLPGGLTLPYLCANWCFASGRHTTGACDTSALTYSERSSLSSTQCTAL